MKRILWTVMLATIFMLVSCSAIECECDATVIDFVFEEDDLVGFRAVAVVLETEEGETINLTFDDIQSTQTIVSGTLEIVVGKDGKRLESYDNYAHVFVLKDKTQVMLKLGSVVALSQTNNGEWELNE